MAFAAGGAPSQSRLRQRPFLIGCLALTLLGVTRASISTAGRLTLNTDPLALPRPLGELVIVHELIHLLAPNHGWGLKRCWYALLTDWEELCRLHAAAFLKK